MADGWVDGQNWADASPGKVGRKVWAQVTTSEAGANPFNITYDIAIDDYRDSSGQCSIGTASLRVVTRSKITGAISSGDTVVDSGLLSWHPSCVMSVSGTATVKIDYARYDVIGLDLVGYSKGGRYYAVGWPDRPVGGVENPQRWWETVVTCEDSSGSKTYERAQSSIFSEYDEVWPDYPEVTCVKPLTLTHMEIWQHSDYAEKQLEYSWDLPAEQKQWLRDYPNCVDGSCTLELQRFDTESRRWLACFDDPSLCLNWFDDPQKEILYQCVYNGVKQALEDCNLYSKLFDFEDPTMITDPETGLGEPGSNPVNPTNPEPETNPWAVTIDQNLNCPPPFSWTSLVNPWWYYQGVKCATVEVFAPKIDRSPFEPALAAFQQGKLGQLIYGFEDQLETLQAGAPRCKGPGGTLAFFGTATEFYPLDSCSGWQAEYAPLVNAFTRFIIGVTTLLTVVTVLMRSFGFNPGGSSD